MLGLGAVRQSTGVPVGATEELHVCAAGSAFHGQESSGTLFSRSEAHNAH